MSKVAIIGAGNIGRAIAEIIRPKKPHIEFWDKDPSKAPGQKELREVIRGADFVFLCTPSWAIPEAVKEMKPHLERKTVIVSIAKGIEVKSGKTMDELLARILPQNQSFVLLSGPMLAGELVEHMGGSAMAASRSAAACKRIAALFSKTELHVQTTSDVRGTALAGVLKNIYALLLGAAEGMQSGWNAKGLIAAEAIREMGQIMPLLGGKKETATCPAGLGDLVATGMSPLSRNHQVGFALASGQNGPLTSEGTNSLPFILKRLGAKKKNFILLAIAADFIKHPAHGKKELKKFFTGA